MAGAPDSATLASSQLVAGGCEQNREVVNTRIARQVEAMRRKVEAEYAEWKELLPCEERGITWDSGGLGATGAGEAFGSGGLGLSGVGEGGGGSMFPAERPAPSVRRAASASGTNDQVEGVDEADLVKNDGAYVYVASHGALLIAAALPPKRLDHDAARRSEGAARRG